MPHSAAQPPLAELRMLVAGALTLSGWNGADVWKAPHRGAQTGACDHRGGGLHGSSTPRENPPTLRDGAMGDEREAAGAEPATQSLFGPQ
jgi:hypothetical protein